MSLFTILGTDRHDVVGAFLRDNYITNEEESKRRAHAAMLDEFFRGCGDKEMERVIRLLWTDPKNAERRIAVMNAGLDKCDNFLARIAQEKATVYNEPTQRKVDNNTNQVYQGFMGVLPMDVIMRSLDTILAYQGDAMLWYRVRLKPTGEREPVLEVVSPACFWAVCHPKDRTLLIAVIFDIRTATSRPEDPSYRVWTDDQTFVMNTKCEILGDPQDWPLGRMPGVLCSMVEPSAKGSLLDEYPSIDLLSAQKAVRLQNLNLAKESVSAGRQLFYQGDTSNVTRGQTEDTEGGIELGGGVVATSVDRGVDTEQYIANATHAADTAGANHGVPPTVRSQKDASSGAEIELRMLPIRKLREKRIPIFRRIEAAMVKIMAMVNGLRVVAGSDGEPVAMEGDLSEFAFNADGFSIDYGEVQQVMTEKEKDDTYEQRKRLQLTDPYEEEMRRNPDIKTVDDAKEIVDERIKRNTEFVTSQKDLMAASGALGAAQPKTEFEANRGEAEDKGEDTQDSTEPKRRFPFAVKK